MLKFTKVRHPKKRAFLAAFAECGNVTRACELSGVPRCDHYRWKRTDLKYAEFFSQAEEQAGDRLEAEARRRAVKGVNEPVFYQGAQCGVVRKYSDTLLIFLLKGARPEKYKDRQAHEHSGPGGGAIQLKVIYEDDQGDDEGNGGTE